MIDMTTAARPGIPRDYNELLRNFGPFIANEIRKRNTVVDNFEDAYQEVLLKLFEAQIIEKFHARVADCAPETQTALEACVTLCITWGQWQPKMRAFHKGRPSRSKDGTRTPGKWMPTPISGGYTSKTAVFASGDILQINDLENVSHEWRRREPMAAPPTPQATPYQFLNYLGTACRNHFANFCRTRSRKWQDRTGDSMPGKRLLGENTPQFRTEEGAYNNHWEDTIRDEIADTRIEAQVDLSRALDKIAARVPERAMQEEIAKNLSDGYTLAEAIKRSSLPPAKKRTLARVFA
jgi:DNA-directed RNA polymerase specialized sigma24 family protein